MPLFLCVVQTENLSIYQIEKCEMLMITISSNLIGLYFSTNIESYRLFLTLLIACSMFETLVIYSVFYAKLKKGLQ